MNRLKTIYQLEVILNSSMSIFYRLVKKSRMNVMYLNPKWSLLTLVIFIFSCGNDPKEAKGVEQEQNPVEFLTTEIVQNPNNPELYFKRAEIFYENETYQDAVNDLSQAVALDSNKYEYYHLLADVYLDGFKSFDALRVMKSAADRFPENIPTLLKLSEFQHILKQHSNCFKTIDQILKKDPQNAEAYFMMGLALREVGETNRAINSFQSSVENDPKLIDGWIVLGQMYTELGDPLALKYFENAQLIEPDNMEVLHAKANYLNEQKDLNGALAIYNEMIIKDPKYKDSYYNSGLIYLEMDSLQKAIEKFDILIEVSPLSIPGYYYRGLSKELAGDRDGAKKDFKQALKFSPNYLKAQEGLERVEQEL